MIRYKGEIPNGVNISNNIKHIKEYQKTHSSYETLKYFILKVQSGGEWDYKRYDEEAIKNHTKSKYEDFGNWHYGVIGKAIGLPDSILLSGAGGAQISSIKGGSILFNAPIDFLESLKNSKSSRDFGLNDDLVDRKNILDGIDDYNDIYGKDYSRVDDMIDFWKAENSFTRAIDTISYFFNPLDLRYKELSIALKNTNTILDNFSSSSSITLYDPLSLDLNNDGVISTTNLGNGVYFDHNGDNIAFKSTWINKDDGLLVYDKNGNGLIDSGAELFGNFSVKKSGELAKDGFEALRDLDSNKDAIVSNLDDEYVNLKVWQDLNQRLINL